MPRLLVLAFMIAACTSGEPELTVAARAARHTASARTDAMSALNDGLNEAYLTLRDAPGDRARALTRARHALEKFYLPDEAAAFQLEVADNFWMLYIPVKKAPTVWLARDKDHLLNELSQLPAEAKPKLGLGL